MKAIVIYKSKYGFTETYAKWIAEDLGADLITADKVKPEDLQKYNVIVYGGGLYAGSVSGINLITKNFESIKNKALYLFTVGVSDVTDKESIDRIGNSLGQVLTQPMLEKIKIYHFRGGMMYSKMSLIHRAMMGMMVRILRKKSESESSVDDKIVVNNYRKDINLTDRNMIAPLMEDIKTDTAPCNQ